MLHRLGVESTALGFSGGFIGDAIEKMLAEEGVSADMIRCAGNSRINVKIKSRAETEINGTGAVIIYAASKPTAQITILTIECKKAVT